MYAALLVLLLLGLLSTHPAVASITVGHESAAGESGGKISLSLTCNDGDLVLIGVQVYTSTASTPTVSNGTFSAVSGGSVSGSTFGSAFAEDTYEMVASQAYSGATVSVSISGSYASAELIVVEGTAGIDATGTAADPGNNPATPSATVTTVAANDLVVAFVGASGEYFSSAGSGFTLEKDYDATGEISACEASNSQSYAADTQVTAGFSGAMYYGEVALALKPIVPPAAPTNLSATPGNSQVDLAWTGSSGATSYNVYRGTASGAETVYQSDITGTSYNDSAATVGTTYYYEVTAVNSAGESGKSNEVSAAPLPPNFTLSDSPASLTVEQGSGGPTTITVSPVSGFTGSVTLSLVNPPSGITSTFNPTPVSISGSAATSTLTLSPDHTVALGNYTVTVQGVSGSITQTTTVTLTVTLGAPLAPTSLTAAGGNAQVSLNWVAPVNSTVTSYNLYRSTSSGGEGSTPYKTGISGTSYSDSGLSNGTTYYYQVTAVNTAGESAKSGEASAATIPSAPTSLSATAGNAQVSLSWTATNGATSYNVYRGTTSGGESSSPIATGVTSASYTDTSVTNDSIYYYEVTAVNSGGESGKSNEASATPMAPPAAPTNLTATAGNAQISLSWTASSGAASYNVYRGTSSGGEGSTPIATGVNTTSYLDTGLTNGTTYYYEVTAVDSFGEGAPSSEADATPENPVFTSIVVAPSSALVGLGTTQQFTATAMDQFGNPLSTQPQFTWSLESNSDGTIDQTGLYTAGNQIGSDTVQAQSGSLTGTASAIDILAPPNPPSGGDSPQARGKIERGLQPMDSGSITIPSGLQMISVPYSYDWSTTTLADVFGFSDPILAIWNPALSGGEYVVTPTAPANEVVPGSGYWCNFSSPSTVLAGTQLNPQQPYTITLNSGSTVDSCWNMIGDPFPTSIAINACTFNNESCVQAIQSKLINGAVYYYDNSTGTYQPLNATTATLNPGVGYWILVAQNVGSVQMAFPGSNAPPSVPAPTAKPNPVLGFGPLTTTLSANSYDASGGSDIIYSWSASPSTGVTFGTGNNTNSAATIQATMPGPGQYTFTVTATNPYGDAYGSKTVTANSAAPTSLTATAGNAQVQLSWTATNGATSYNVYRGTSSGGESATPIATGIGGTSYTDTGVSNDTTYYYEVAALNSSSQPSGMSNEASATPYSSFQSVLDIDCGSNSAFQIPDTIDNIVSSETTFSEDTDYSSGSPYSTSQPITWADDQGGNDYPLLQTQRVSQPGQSFTYSLPLPNGSYELGLYFADIRNSSLGQNVFNVTVNGEPVLQNFDIIQAAQSQYAGTSQYNGTGQYEGVERFIPFYVFDNNAGQNNTTIAFTPTTGTSIAAVAGISISKYANIQPEQRIGAVGGGVIQDIPTPGWAQSDEPEDSMSSGGAGPSASESVSLSAGIEQNDSGPDISAFNPIGPSVSYEREYRSSVEAAGYYSAGLTPGWTDNFDFAIVPQQPYTWGALTLYYPDGAAETIQPGTASQDNNGTPIPLGAPTGAPYTVTGTPMLPSTNSAFSTVGEWQSFQITWGDQSVWTFAPDPASFFQPYCVLYYLTSITNVLGQTIYINRSGDTSVPLELDHITSITDGDGNTLLSFQYNPADGTLQSVTDNNNRVVTYGYASATGPSGSFTALQSASVIDSTTELWQYGYDPTTGYLNSAETLDPNGSGSYNGYQVQFDGDGRVSTHTDANSNVCTYDYSGAGSGDTVVTSATQSEITAGTNDLAWTQYFNTNLNHLGTGDQNPSGRITLAYGDGNNPYAVTQAYDRMNFETVLSYADQYGHLQTATPPGGPVSTSSYVQVGLNNANTNSPVVTPSITDQPGTVTVSGGGHQITPVQLTYLQNGLVYTASWPVPGQIYATQFETATYSYDSLGDVTSITEPGPNGTTTISLDYKNGYNGYDRTQPVIDEPLTVEVSGPSSDGTTTKQYTYYEYDNLGDTTAVIDAMGNETDYQYNNAGQLTETIEPATGEVGTNRVTTVYNYAYLGGPVTSVALYGENQSLPANLSTPFEQATYQYGPEGELKSVTQLKSTTGQTEQVNYGYDSLYRQTSVTDGDGHETQYFYDTSGNLQYVEYPDGSEEKYSYNPDGTLYQYTDCNGVTRTYIRNPGGITSNPIVDPNEVWEVTYSSGLNPIYYDWDGFERISSILSADSGTSTYALDDLGNVITDQEQINGLPSNNNTFTSSYNYNPDSSVSSSTYENYSYDGLGRIITQQPSSSVVNISENGGEYGDQNQVDNVTPDEFKYSYLANGWLQNVGTFIASAEGLDGAYNEPAIQTNYVYDARGNLTVLANTMWESNIPNASTEPINTVLSTFGNPNWGISGINGDPYGMTYDAAGNRLQEVSFINPLWNNSSANAFLDAFDVNTTPSLTGELIYPHTITYGYDLLNELTSEGSATQQSPGQVGGGGGVPFLPYIGNDYGYGHNYDLAGNPTELRNSTFSPYDSDNQLSVSGLGYDANGNTTDFGGLTTSYDPEDRLTSMPYTYNGQNGTFDAGYYASTGLRLYKDGINGRTYYIYDGDEPVEELDSNGNLIATNVYGPTGLMARYYTSDEGISNAGGQSLMGNTVYYTYDPQGNVVQRLVTPDVLGNEGGGGEYDYPLPWPLMPLDTEYYDAFGAQHWDIDRATGEQEGYQDPFGYGAQWGYYTDNETGLVLMGHRYYAYGNGHFLTRDPIGTAGGINLYGFCGNNPITGADSDGTKPNKFQHWWHKNVTLKVRSWGPSVGALFTAWIEYGDDSSEYSPIDSGAGGSSPEVEEEQEQQSELQQDEEDRAFEDRLITTEAGSIRKVNPPGPGRTQNCVNCAVATDATLRGRPASALPSSGPMLITKLETAYGTKWQTVQSIPDLEKQLSAEGPGAGGIVFGSYGPNIPGHVFNVINQKGTIRFLDGQSGVKADLSPFKSFLFLPTK